MKMELFVRKVTDVTQMDMRDGEFEPQTRRTEITLLQPTNGAEKDGVRLSSEYLVLIYEGEPQHKVGGKITLELGGFGSTT